MKNFYYSLEYNLIESTVLEYYPVDKKLECDSISFQLNSRYFLTEQLCIDHIIADIHTRSCQLTDHDKKTYRCVMTQNPFTGGHDKTQTATIDKSFWPRDKIAVYCILNEEETDYLLRYTMYSRPDKLVYPESFNEYHQHLNYSNQIH